MKVLVLSDSHGCVSHMERAVELCAPDCIVHLGDCCPDAEELHARYPRIPLEQVPGNCDFGRFEAAERLIFLENKHVLLAHGHTLGVKQGLLRAQYRARELGADVLLFGHTHEPLVDVQEGLILLNPGTVGYGTRATYGLLDFHDGQCIPSVYRIE